MADEPETVDELAITNEREKEPEDGVALCLSGGGYRAMLFHAGALLRLAEAGRLGSLTRVSSVSGGSITAGVLALAWGRLEQEGFSAEAVEREVVRPLREQANRAIDRPATVLSLFPIITASRWVARRYRKLFRRATLQDLPDYPPLFVFNATNLESAVLWRFSKAYARDYKVGGVDRPNIELAKVVAASSAFPPFLGPARFKVGPYKPTLVDGGVYDNLGLQTVQRFRTVLVSDGGGHIKDKGRVATFWPSQLYRVMMVMDNQVRSLRKYAVVQSFVAGRRKGAYWGIRTDIADYPLKDPLPCPEDKTRVLADLKTSLWPFDDATQKRLINWGYAVCDAALRAHVDSDLTKPAGFPYPDEGVG
jgi:NTE family protein